MDLLMLALFIFKLWISPFFPAAFTASKCRIITGSITEGGLHSKLILLATGPIKRPKLTMN